MTAAGTARSAVVLSSDPRWSESVSSVLERVGVRVAATASEAGEALRLARGIGPQFVVVDAEPNGFDAPRFIRGARDAARDAQVIALAKTGDAEGVKRSLEAGAFAVVVKGEDGGAGEVAVAARQAFDTSLYFAPPSTNGTSDEVARSGLTPRELDVLRLVGEGKSNAQIARALWVTEQTVKFHLSNIYRKLGLSNRTEAARWAALRGVLDWSGR